MGNDEYLKVLQKDNKISEEYYKKSLQKTEQQKFLEELLFTKERGERSTCLNIGDIACGGGTLSYHLKPLYQHANFHLLDYNQDALNIAKEINKERSFSFYNGSIYDMPFEDNKFDLVFCWQTLAWIDDQEKVLRELIRIARKGTRIYISSLFNIEHDVDIYCRIIDHTRESASYGLGVNYITLSKYTIERWLKGIVSSFEIHKFTPQVDFGYEGRGLGTFTKKLETGERIQISAGLLLNWGVLIIEK